MKSISMVILALLLLVSGAASGASDAPPAKAPAKTEVPKAAAGPAKADPRSASGPVTVAAGSQQNRMRECNKSATGKKGPERKAFMKTCLSTHKG